MAANARALRLLLQPDQRLLVLRPRRGALAGVIVEVHNTYGGRHAYLVHPDEQGRARVDKALYVSPFHGTDGWYDVPCRSRATTCWWPSPCTPTTARRSAPRWPVGVPTTSPLRAAPAALRGVGPDPRPRHRAVAAPPARPTHDPPTTTPSCTGVPDDHRSSADPRSTSGPTSAQVPTGPRAAVSAAVARRLFEAGVRRLPSPSTSRAATIGRGGPEMTVHRPEEFFARLGRGALIGFGEAYLTGAWDADDLGAFLTVLAAEMPRLVPDSLQRLRAVAVRRPPRARAQHPGQPRQQHRPPLRPVQRPVRAVPRRRR